METKAFNNKQFVYFDMPAIKGWHECSEKEYFAWQPTYHGNCDHDKLHWIGAKIPKDIMTKALALIKHFTRTEVMVALYYSARENKWLANVPPQYGSGASVHYESDYQPPVGYGFCGTIHSHPQMSAFWSGTDKNDQCSKNGLHIVVGTDSNGDMSTYLCSLWYNGQCYEAKDQVEMPDKTETEEAPKDWVDIITTSKLKEKAATKSIETCNKISGHNYKLNKPSYSWESSVNKIDAMADEDWYDYLLLGCTTEDKLGLVSHLIKQLNMEDIATVVEDTYKDLDTRKDEPTSSSEYTNYDYYDLYEELMKDQEKEAKDVFN